MVNAKQIDWSNCSQNMNLSKLSSSTYFAKLSRKPLHRLQIHKKIRYSGIVDESIFVNISRETFNLERIWKWNAIWSRKKKLILFLPLIVYNLCIGKQGDQLPTDWMYNASHTIANNRWNFPPRFQHCVVSTMATLSYFDGFVHVRILAYAREQRKYHKKTLRF